MTETPADRVRELRRLLGDGTYPLSQAKLAVQLTQLSGKRYHATMVTKMEAGARRVTDRDARWLAALDPQHRGVAWVLCWPEAEGAPASGQQPKPTMRHESVTRVGVGRDAKNEEAARGVGGSSKREA